MDQLENRVAMLLKQNEELLIKLEKILPILSSNTSLDMDGASSDKKTAIIYAYRYLLNREPESIEIVENNTLDWKTLRKTFMQSPEYKMQHSEVEMPYQSLQVEGITYFYNSLDKIIPWTMYSSGLNWAKHDIDNFIHTTDRMFYRKSLITPQTTGFFLDIGGNIGTTSIYCKLKLKPNLQFIAFEPVQENAALFSINNIINGVDRDIKVEKVALSNQSTNDRVIAVPLDNSGGGSVMESENARSLEQDGIQIERVSEITLDEYLLKNQISGEQIKYIWIDVEGYEPEILEGATELLKKHQIPTCIEFNQGRYRACQKYEKMLKLLEDYFNYFVLCQDATSSKVSPRPINEVAGLWEEFNHESCDLILF